MKNPKKSTKNRKIGQNVFIQPKTTLETDIMSNGVVLDEIEKKK